MGTTGVATPAGISNDLVQTQPEQTDSIEAGFKGTAFDRAVTYSVSAFYQKINNYISRFDAIYYDAPDAQPQNAQFAFNYNGDATIKGVEAQIGVKPMRDWDFNVAASYTRARFKNAMVPCNTLDANGNFFVRGPGNVSYCKSNGRVSETPDFSLTANTELRFPIESAGVTPYIQALFVYTPGFYSERVDYHYQNRENLNLFVGVRAEDAKWELSGFVRNLLNQKRITNRGQGTGQFNTILGGVIDSGYRGVNVTNPREFGVTLSHRW
jgi:iron complex outermembrane receptor protein